MPLARPARGELLHQGRLAIPDAADSPTKKPPINRWDHRYLGEERLPETLSALEALLNAPAANAASGEVGRAPLLALRAGSSQASLQSVGEEADKLARIRALALPADLFADLPLNRAGFPGGSNP